MGQWRFHTPDGVADLPPAECAAKRRIEDKLRQFFRLWGYQEIETPGIEFYDVYASGAGQAAQEGLFKFVDQQGRILCLRYDGTIPVARLAATVCRDIEPPIRFSYIGSMYRYNEYGGGRQREFSQAGIELLGSQSPEADAEVIAAAIAASLACDIKDIQVSLGQVDFFKGFVEAWGLSGEDAGRLPHLIDSKEMVALEELSSRLRLPDKARNVLIKMASSYGTFDLLDEMAQMVTSPVSLKALQNLRDVLVILDEYGYLPYVSVDLGMLQSLDYYTGIIFKGFTYGIGFPLFSGGRYDRLVRSYGRDISATGFSIGINFVLTALRRQNLLVPEKTKTVLIGFDAARRAEAIRLAESFRNQGQAAILDCDGRLAEELAALTKREKSTMAVFLGEDGGQVQFGGEERP